MFNNSVNVVIDVLRAFTVAHYYFINGAKRIFLFPSPSYALDYKKLNPQILIGGERHARKINQFDFGNSPFEIENKNMDDKEIGITTTNGVTAALHSLSFGKVFVTGFSNARSTAYYLLKNFRIGTFDINIIASHPDGDDDLACAEYIKSILIGKPLDSLDIRNRIFNCYAAKKFIDPTNDHFRIEDLEICTKEIDSNFVMKLNTSSEIPSIISVCNEKIS